ncbi:MAG: hypothetical protein QOF97_1893 [Acidimicrobiaceae bacterium]
MTVLQPQQPGIPTGAHSAPAEAYWEGCRQGELRYQRCADCGSVNMAPARSCGACGAQAMTWERSAGSGRLYSWTVVWRPQHPSFEVPYAPAIVELDEGFWLMTAIVGCEPEALRVDMPVEVEFHPASDDVVLPYFRPISRT